MQGPRWLRLGTSSSYSGCRWLPWVGAGRVLCWQAVRHLLMRWRGWRRCWRRSWEVRGWCALSLLPQSRETVPELELELELVVALRPSVAEH